VEEMIAIKKLASENNIPFIIGEMNQETLELFNFDLNYEGLEKEHYYELFQLRYDNRETKFLNIFVLEVILIFGLE
jgi:hypothetical protein